jgi:hypothetical protein
MHMTASILIVRSMPKVSATTATTSSVETQCAHYAHIQIKKLIAGKDASPVTRNGKINDQRF